MALRKIFLMGVLMALTALVGFTAAGARASAKEASVIVAVVDSGVNPVGAIPASQMVSGYSFVGDSTDTSDPVNHGTQMAAIIATSCNRCKIMPIKISFGSLTDPKVSASIAAGIQKAKALGAQVINISLGSKGYDTGGAEAAVDQVVAQGATAVVSAGNENSNDGSINHWASGSPSAIRVGAVSARMELTGNSNHGSWVDIAAQASFTSDAAAYTSSVVGQMLSFAPGLTPAQVKQTLLSTGTSVPDLDVVCHCVVNDSAAIAKVKPVTPPPPAKMAKLSVHKIGRGSVTSKPVAVRCEAAAVPTCTTTLGWGKSVVLMAKPLKGWKFGHWSGACKGIKPTCTVPPLNKTVTSVTAFFVRAKK